MRREHCDRREFMVWMGSCGLALLAAAGGLTVCGGCQGKQEAEKLGAQPRRAIDAAQAAADPCNDLSALSPAELATRQTFKYNKRSPDPTRICRDCNFWQADRHAAPCGTCTIVKGPVHPLGSCQSWAAKAAG